MRVRKYELPAFGTGLVYRILGPGTPTYSRDPEPQKIQIQIDFLGKTANFLHFNTLGKEKFAVF